ncbi:MAG: hypothetical protein OEZ47_07270 [Gammaproteobacteria bacterium]|nr:hypothetical protein [Gammaproteobacteria bacterium]
MDSSKYKHKLYTRRIRIFFMLLVLGVMVCDAHAAEGNPVPTPAYENQQPSAVDTIDFNSRDKEFLRDAGVQGKFLKMLESPEALNEYILNNISGEVHRIAFYRMSDRQNKRFPKTLYESIEQTLINKFTSVRRFGVHECLQCKTTRVLLRNNQLQVLRHFESNDNLKKVGSEIKVDHFVMWDAYTDLESAVINLRIVSVDTGQVRWSRQFRSGDVGSEISREFYTSFWGLNVTRAATDATVTSVSASPVIATGFRMISRSTVSNHVYYGYGLEFFSNTTEISSVLATGININGRLAIELDPLFRRTAPEYGNWLLYLMVGQAFIINNPAVTAGAGLEVKPTRKAFLSLGALYMAPTNFETFASAGLADTAKIGGMGYEITLGYRF